MKTKVWDLPVRLFHVLLILLVAVQWWSGERLEDPPVLGAEIMDIHIWSGLAILALVLFRIVWGFAGSTTARFGHFLKGPAAIGRYVGGLFGRGGDHAAGHNPLGGLSVIAMLLVLLGLPLLGLFAADSDDIMFGFGPAGPLSGLIDEDTAKQAADLHETLFTVLQVLVAVHVAAILFYLAVKRQNLIGPMITGKADVETAETLRFRPLWLAVLILAVTGGGVAAVVAAAS